MPDGWEKKKLEDLSEFITKGATPTTSGHAWADSGIPFLRSECVSENGFSLRGAAFICEKAHAEMSRSVIKAGDILMTITGYIGRVCMVPESIKEANINQHIARVRIKDDLVSTKYILHYLSQGTVRTNFSKINTGQAYPQLSLEQVRNTEVAMPPRREQDKIANILSTWDEAIDILNKALTLKEKRKSELAAKILSGTLRLKGYSKSWSKKKLKELGKCVRGLTYSPTNVVNDGLLVLRSSNILNGRISLEDKVFVDIEVQDQFLSKEGDILICVRNGSRNLIGKTALIPASLPKATHGAFMSVFRTKYSSYVFQLFQTELYREQVAKNLGATINSINNSDLMEFSFPFPSEDEEVQEISTRLESFDQEISALRRIRLSYQKQKQGLMQQLLSGKKRVKV